MPIEAGNDPGGLVLRASFRISCEDFNFRLRYSPLVAVADFPSIGMLFQARKMSRYIDELIADLPPLPPSIKLRGKSRDGSNSRLDTEVLVAVKSRPIGRIAFSGGKARFVPTPLRFFRKV